MAVCHRTWCQGAIASLARHFAVGLVFWLEVSVTADCDCGSNSLDFKQLTVLFLSGAGLFADKHLPCWVLQPLAIRAVCRIPTHDIYCTKRRWCIAAWLPGRFLSGSCSRTYFKWCIVMGFIGVFQLAFVNFVHLLLPDEWRDPRMGGMCDHGIIMS